MPTNPRQRTVLMFLLLILAILAALNVWRGTHNALRTQGSGRSTDFHAHWNPAHGIRGRVDPYFYMRHAQTTTSVLGKFGTHDDPTLDQAPTNLPLMLFIITPFTLTDWETARAAWLVLNLVLAVVCVAVAGHWFGVQGWGPWLGMALAFLALTPIRDTLSNGQTTLVVAAALVAAGALARTYPMLAGVFLAVGFSKYVMALPLLPWFILMGYWQVVVIATVVQIGTWLAFAWAVQTAPDFLWAEYRQIISWHGDKLTDLDLPSQLLRLGLPDWVATVATLLGIGIIGALSVRWWWQMRGNMTPRGESLLFIFLAVGGLAVLYHRAHDGTLLVLVMAGALTLPQMPPRWEVIAWGGIFMLYVWPPSIVERLSGTEDAYPLLATAATLLSTALVYGWLQKEKRKLSDSSR